MKNQNPDVTIIGVPNATDGDDRERLKFVTNMTVQISHVLEDSADVWVEYGVHSQPSMVFVNADGTFERHVGRQDPPELLERVTALLTPS